MSLNKCILKEELKLFRPQHCKNQQEYLEESWKPKEISCRLDSYEKLSSVKKNSLGIE